MNRWALIHHYYVGPCFLVEFEDGRSIYGALASLSANIWPTFTDFDQVCLIWAGLDQIGASFEEGWR